MKKLKDFKILKNELLKSWDNQTTKNFIFKDIDTIKMHIYSIIKSNFNNNIIYEKGEIPKYSNLGFFEPKEEVERVFGFPYTSSSNFAMLSNTNTQARANIKKYNLYFKYVAVNTNNEIVLIFEDKKENYFYFVENEFSNFMEQEKEKERAKQIEIFKKDTNKAIIIINDIFKKYDGKQYGKATKNKIYKEIEEQAKIFNFDFFYIEKCFKDFRITFRKFINHKQEEISFYLNIIDEYNTIKSIDEKVPQNKEFDGIKTAERQFKLKEQIKKESQKLLKLVNEYNQNLLNLNYFPKDTSTHNYKLYSIANYTIENE